jgi:hypothetical protein
VARKWRAATAFFPHPRSPLRAVVGQLNKPRAEKNACGRPLKRARGEQLPQTPIELFLIAVSESGGELLVAAYGGNETVGLALVGQVQQPDVEHLGRRTTTADVGRKLFPRRKEKLGFPWHPCPPVYA